LEGGSIMVKTKNTQNFTVACLIRTKTGKYFRTDSSSVMRIINFLKKYNGVKYRVRCIYGWGDNEAKFNNKNKAMNFIKECRKDFLEFKKEKII